MKKRPAQTKTDALLSLMYEAGRDSASPSRYPSVKRALRTLEIAEDSDDWHRVLTYVGYHDSKTRAPHAWLVPKPRPQSFRIAFVGWRRRGRAIDDAEAQGYNIRDYARDAGITLDGYKKKSEAETAAHKMRPDKDGIYPKWETEPVYESD